MKKLILSLVALGSSFSLSQAILIDFETGYSAGDLNGQPSSGTQWSRTLGAVNDVNVATGIGTGGSNGITGEDNGSGSNFVFYGFAPSASDLEGTFDSASSIVSYSFDWRATETLDGSTSTNIFAFIVGSDSTSGSNPALNLNIRGQGRLVANDGGSNRAADGLFTVNTYSTISGDIDYATKTFTVFVDGTQQYTSFNGGNLSFANAASDNAEIRLGNLSGGSLSANYRTWNADNISIAVPEPTSAAMLVGALGLLALRRRK